MCLDVLLLCTRPAQAQVRLPQQFPPAEVNCWGSRSSGRWSWSGSAGPRLRCWWGPASLAFLSLFLIFLLTPAPGPGGSLCCGQGEDVQDPGAGAGLQDVDQRGLGEDVELPGGRGAAGRAGWVGPALLTPAPALLVPAPALLIPAPALLIPAPALLTHASAL